MAHSSKLFSDQLRAAVLHCGASKYRISKDTGIDIATLSRFEAGAGLALDTVDKLVSYLSLELKKKRSA